VWRPKRKDSSEAQRQTAVIERPVEEFDGTVGELRAEIERLTEGNRAHPDRDTERRLLMLRHLAGIKLIDEAESRGDPVFAAAAGGSLPAGDQLPELNPDQLSAGTLRAGILRDGCLLLRGLVPRDRALAMAKQIDRAYGEREKSEKGKRPAPGYYEEFEPHERCGSVFGRPWIKQGGGLLAADSPTLAFQMMELFDGAGLRATVSDYLGEPALISVHKTTLRRADPSVPGAWHQDGFFMGEVRSLNLWLSLSRCGDVAPGLDIVPRRLDHLVQAATEEAALDYTVSNKKAAEAAGDRPIIRPIFEPGDALFFDEMFLHQTGSDPEMPNPRYAIENWFFGGSAFPGEYAPIAV
jgi:hypothetical protein